MYNNYRGTEMVEKLSNKILCFLINDDKIDSEKKEVLLFGITRIVEDIPKTIGIVLIGILLNIIKEMLIVTTVIMLYKTFVGGVHAKTNFGCFISSVIFYLAIIYISKFFYFENEKVYILLVVLNYIFSLYCIWVYAPADVPEIPKVNEKLRKRTKISAILMLNAIYIVTLVVIKDSMIQRLVMLSIFSINLMTTRTMYNLFKNEYGYETYFPYDE